MRLTRNLLAFAGGAAVLVALVLLMAPTGGFPSRPTFQAVTIRQATTGSNDDRFLELRDSDTPNADGGIWRLTPQSSGASDCLTLRTYTDALVATGIPLDICRTGAVIDSVGIGASSLNLNDGVGASATIKRTSTSLSAPSGAGMLVGDTIRISKSADESRASTITPAVDTHLQVTALPAGHYAVKAYLYFTDGAGGHRMRFDISGADNIRGTGTRQCTTGGSTAVAHDEGFDLICAGAGSGQFFLGGGTEKPTAAATTISIFWAQNTSNAAATTLESFSWLEVTRLN